jgi:hypothetical protein
MRIIQESIQRPAHGQPTAPAAPHWGVPGALPWPKRTQFQIATRLALSWVFAFMGIDVAFSRMQPVFEAAKAAKADGKIPAKMRKSLSDYLQVLKSQLIAWTEQAQKRQSGKSGKTLGLSICKIIFFIFLLFYSLSSILYIIFFFSKREETNCFIRFWLDFRPVTH